LSFSFLQRAARRKRVAGRVVGLSRSAATVRRAKQRGAIDAGTTDARDAVRDADLVILAGPVDTIAPAGKRLARWMKPGSVLTDVGSTKSEIVAALETSLPRGPRGICYIGSHPIAGSEQRGIDAASAGLFAGASCLLTPTARTHPKALRAATQLWQRLGMRVSRMTPDAHDRLLGATSHLPHLIAFCLASSADPSRLGMPKSWLEMTRLAKSDPDLWDDIFLSNRAAVGKAADRLTGQIRTLRQAIVRGDRAAIVKFLRHAKAIRDAIRD